MSQIEAQIGRQKERTEASRPAAAARGSAPSGRFPARMRRTSTPTALPRTPAASCSSASDARPDPRRLLGVVTPTRSQAHPP
jgi:hypothetical protein